METGNQKLLDRLRRLCSAREYCSLDIRKKALAALDGDQQAAAAVLETLVNEKYVDDLRFASSFARDKSSISGWGDVKIRYMLASKGIPKETIEAALAEIDRDKAGDRLEKLVQNKWKSLKDDPQGRLKLIRFALGRGYGYEEVTSCLNRLNR